jgi:hypothetical protein
MVTRRDFLAGATAVTALSLTSAVKADVPSPSLLSAVKSNGQDAGALWRADTTKPFALPCRGHAPAEMPDGRAIIVGRRPGLFSAIVRPSDIEAPAVVLDPAPGQRFAGHAAITPDGKRLFNSEFDASNTAAAIAVRDPATGRVVDVWHPPGIEPHEMHMAGGGSRLVVALGGLINDGSVGGPAFNAGGIDSAVLEIDPRSGTLLARHKLRPDLATLSLRHFAVAPNGTTIAIGMQDQDLSLPRPVMAVLELGKELEPLPMPEGEASFRGYVGSVAIDASGTYVVATSPRTSTAGLWSLAARRWIGALHLPDVCGLTAGAAPGAFWATSGHGDVFALNATATGLTQKQRWHTDTGFDNHVLRLSA